jgi:hypothetical protein
MHRKKIRMCKHELIDKGSLNVRVQPSVYPNRKKMCNLKIEHQNEACCMYKERYAQSRGFKDKDFRKKNCLVYITNLILFTMTVQI